MADCVSAVWFTLWKCDLVLDSVHKHWRLHRASLSLCVQHSIVTHHTSVDQFNDMHRGHQGRIIALDKPSLFAKTIPSAMSHLFLGKLLEREHCKSAPYPALFRASGFTCTRPHNSVTLHWRVCHRKLNWQNHICPDFLGSFEEQMPCAAWLL